jgi:CubicO group peptidase (beta-lactamase class C family)
VTAAVAALVVAAGCSAGPSPSATTAAAETTFASPSTSSTSSPPTVAGVDDWGSSTPEAQGMSSAVLAGLFDAIVARGYRVDGVVIVRHGSVVVEAVGAGYREDTFHIVHSVTKSVISTLIGIAIDDGYLDGVDQRVLDVFADRDVANLDGRKEQMTIEHLLTMTTGLDCRDSYLHRWKGLMELEASDDWTQHVLDLPMVATPGERFEYCNGASFLLSAIIQEATGRTAKDFARDELFNPIGVTDFRWPPNRDGITIGWGELMIAPHDLARFGQLILERGRWGSRQVVSGDWVEQATRPHVDGTLQEAYGYQWWIRSDGVVEALGYKGQYVIVDRERDIVTVFSSNLPDDDFFVPDDLYDRYVVPAVLSGGALPSDAPALATLETAEKLFSNG